MYTYNVPTNSKYNIFEKYDTLFITLRGVFFALILFCASFLSPYIGCNYQFILKTRPSVRYLLLFLVIYFSVNLVNPNMKNVEHPIYAIMRSLFVFMVFILMNKVPIMTIITIMVFFALLVLASRYHAYYKQDDLNRNENQQMNLDILEIVQWVLVISIFVLLLISVFNKDKKYASITLDKCHT